MTHGVPPHNSTVLKQLAGKHILITGTSGFLGKVVLEKLMRDVPNIGRIYLLIRGNRRYPTARQRFNNEIANSSVFDRLRAEAPERFERLCEERIGCVTGELTEPCFGMPKAQFERLAGRLDAIIHGAASVNFREELDQALAINTLCLKNIVALSSAGGKLPVLQVSTCYVNGFHGGPIGEEVLGPARGGSIPRDNDGYYEVAGLIETLQRKIANARERCSGKALSAELVRLGTQEARARGWNDTYTFTKWLGEQWLLKAMRNASLTIVRPAIVESTLREPRPGWIEGIKVADAVLLAYAREKVTRFPGRRRSAIDVIPADLVANAIIMASAEQLAQPGERHIYQCCSSVRNPLSLGAFIDHVMAEARDNHARYDNLFLRQPSKPLVALDKRVFSTSLASVRTPLAVMARTLRLLGREPDWPLLKNLDDTANLAALFAFYTSSNATYRNDRLLALAERMGEIGAHALFPVDADLIDWEDYLRRVHIAGVNTYALGERQRHRKHVKELEKASGTGIAAFTPLQGFDSLSTETVSAAPPSPATHLDLAAKDEAMHIEAQVIASLGSVTEAQQWMREGQRQFEGLAPRELMHTEAGRQQVKSALTKNDDERLPDLRAG